MPSPWSDAALRGTVDKWIGTGDDKGLPPDVRFIRSVQRLMVKRDGRESPTSGPAVFVLDCESAVETPGLDRVRLLDRGEVPVGGSVWYVGPMLGFARRRTLPKGSGADEIFEHLATASADALPTALFFPGDSPPSVRYYPRGVRLEEEFEDLYFDKTALGIVEVLNELDRLHKDVLESPSAHKHRGEQIWHDGQKCIPVERAEQAIQSYVTLWLAAAFARFTIEPEVTGKAGRLDVAVKGWIESGGHYSQETFAVIEIKALRSYTNTGNATPPGSVLAAVSEGVNQAASYARDYRTKETALCCYDLRSDDDNGACLAHEVRRAELLGVRIRRWYLYSTDRRYRIASNSDASALASQDDE